ncbi:MAG: acetyl-CoA carboxylase biotin carboxylase subunit [Deltaproteobacteria bacterium]
MRGISRVLVANRGEIAVRIIRACQELGIETVVTVSEADTESLAAKLADRAVCIGPPSPRESYLKVNTIVTAALGTGSDAIHPGYGFLAEQPQLADICKAHNLIFVGPKAENIRKMGDKLYARQLSEELGISIIPGSALVRHLEQAKRAAEAVGYPILLKASAGGGGKGMKIVKHPDDMKQIFDEASAEALSAFGDDRIYMEHYIPNARHIEVQIIGDGFGNVIHLYERDCSLQRRYQKMVEEAPSPAVSPELRDRICEAAIRLAKHIGYENAGTVEFMLDQDEQRFYFLEMNTRIQVEHPVTEMITGTDLVKEQFRVASGNSLSSSQEDIHLSGHAIECRINAESPSRDFAPCPGRITEWTPPGGEGIRIDSHCYDDYFVPPYYDSLLAKLIVSAGDRHRAIQGMRHALDHFVVSGIDTTIPFYRYIMTHREYLSGEVNTQWIENRLLEEYEEHDGH